MAKTAIGEGGEDAVTECKKCCIGTFRWPVRIPRSSQRAYALNGRTRDQTHDVDLMRRLVEDRAATFRCLELFRAARTIKIVGVVERIDHTRRAERAALDELETSKGGGAIFN